MPANATSRPPISTGHCATHQTIVTALFAPSALPIQVDSCGPSTMELGPAFSFLPEGAMVHDPNAYLHAMTEPGLGATVQLNGPLVN